MDQVQDLMMFPICHDRPGISPLHLARAGVACSAALPPWPQFAGRQVIGTHLARNGIAALCHHWGIGAGHEILAPAYNCGTEIDALLQTGARVQFYRVDERARIDMDDLYARVTPRTRMVYVIHYFGWPQDLAQLASWCGEHDLKLVEDCALSLFSFGPLAPIGLAGDAAVFSFPKTLPVPDGGAIVLGRPHAGVPSPTRRPPGRQIARKAAGLARNWLVGRLRVAARPRRTGEIAPSLGHAQVPAQAEPSRPDMPANYYYDGQSSDWEMSRITVSLLRHTDAVAVVSRRRHNYLRLHRLLEAAEGLHPLYQSLPEGVCPLAYPVLVSNRRRWVSRLREQGIVAVPWWEGHHRLFSWNDHPEAHQLKMSVLALPVHQDLDEKDMDYIAGIVIGLASSVLELITSHGGVTGNVFEGL